MERIRYSRRRLRHSTPASPTLRGPRRLNACGALQALLAVPLVGLHQIHRNFSETSFLFATSVLALSILNGFGPWSLKGAIVYAAGRTLYLLFSIAPLRPYRKWAWAISIAGIVGCLAELARATMIV